MKILIESWNKFLKESVSEQEKEKSGEVISLWTGNDQLANKLVDQISSLKDSYVVKILGRGTVGAAFQLNNGNVLKLYKNAYIDGGGIESQDKEYERIMNSAFSGTSYKGELVVYAHGIVEGEPKSIMSMGTPSVGWAEINKVTTLRDYYRLLKVPPHLVEEKVVSFEKLVDDIVEFLYHGYLDKEEDVYDAIEMFDESFLNNKINYREALTEKEINAFKYGIFKFFRGVQYNPDMNDVHFDNVGLMWPSDLNSMVVFDY
jgi:hypothetical protein